MNRWSAPRPSFMAPGSSSVAPCLATPSWESKCPQPVACDDSPLQARLVLMTPIHCRRSGRITRIAWCIFVDYFHTWKKKTKTLRKWSSKITLCYFWGGWFQICLGSNGNSKLRESNIQVQKALCFTFNGNRSLCRTVVLFFQVIVNIDKLYQTALSTL